MHLFTKVPLDTLNHVICWDVRVCVLKPKQCQGYAHRRVLCSGETYRVKTIEIDAYEVIDCGGILGIEAIQFRIKDGREYLLMHPEQCCEDVKIEDICGSLRDLVGAAIYVRPEKENVLSDWQSDAKPCGNSLWHFYSFSTVKGDVTIRFSGTITHYATNAVLIEMCEVKE